MSKTGINMLIEYSTSPRRSISLESSPILSNRSISLESSPILSNRSVSLELSNNNSIFYNTIKPYKNSIKQVFVLEDLDLQ
jgi:hypothetical protein